MQKASVLLEKLRNKIFFLGVILFLSFSVGFWIYFSGVESRNNDFVLREWTNDNLVVLLTMTIDTKKNYFTARNNIPDRINDYKKSLKQWARLPYKVIVVENSGYGNPFQDVLKNTRNIQYVSTYIPPNLTHGAGYGEAKTLRYAMEKVIKNDSIYIMKITGRYAPEENLSEVVNILMDKKPDVLLKEMLSDNVYTERSEWFVAKRQFFKELANNCIESCDDRKGLAYSFERHLHSLGHTKKNMLKTNLNIKIIKTRTGGFNVPVSWI